MKHLDLGGRSNGGRGGGAGRGGLNNEETTGRKNRIKQNAPIANGQKPLTSNTSHEKNWIEAAWRLPSHEEKSR
jgi:hypothetical protein